MSSGCCKVLLCLFAVTWILLLQSTNGARNDRRCRDLLRRLLRNPPNNTKIAINIGLSKARYICHEGFKLVGKEVRTCKGGKWIENVETKCSEPCGKPEDIPHSTIAGSSFNFNDQLRYDCIKGYTLTGPRLRTCGNDGKWSKAPKCEGNDRRCRDLLRRLLRNPPNNTKIAINIGLSKARYTCHEGFKLVGQEVRTCKGGKWIEKVETKCLDKPTTQCSRETCRIHRRRGPGINLNEDRGLDLVFLFDASVSVDKFYFQTSLAFARELLRIIGASKRSARTQVAAVTEAKLEFNLGDSKADTIDKAINAIDNIMYVGWVSSYHRPFKLVRNKVAPNSRNDSHQVLMFFTDGLEPSGPVQREAKYLRDHKQFEVYAIGIGRKVKTRALMNIASDHDHVISVRRYITLQEAVQRVVYIDIDYSPCGVSPVDFRARMVGGKNSKRGWWPWQIGLYKTNDRGLQLICGGALISRRWILTAAHCFYHFDPIFGKYRFKDNIGEYMVKAGDHNLERDERSQWDIDPEKFFVHEDYVDRKFENDIALIKLKREVGLSPFVRTLCLPEKDEGDLAIPTKYGFATGWGVTQALKLGERPAAQDRYSRRLQYSAYIIQSDELCANRSAIAINSTVAFCAGDGKGGNDTCIGDGGGAFVREGKRGEDYRWVATGLVSWGEGCAQKNQYGYYTRVYPFTNWIKNTIKENTEADD